MKVSQLFRLRNELRKDARHRVIRTAWIRTKDDPLPSVGVLWDISESGARLAVTRPEAIADELVMSLNREDRDGTVCRVVWRSDEQLGLQFVANAEPIQRLIKQQVTS
jgi:hypothetical protein